LSPRGAKALNERSGKVLAQVPCSDTTTFALSAKVVPEQAGARRAELMADAAYCKSAIEGDTGKQEMLRDSWMLERGYQPPSLRQPVSGDDVRAQMTDRDLELDNARLFTWEKHIRMTDQMKFEHRRGLATNQPSEDAKREIEKMKADRAFAANARRRP
jgi:hypothetical protein